MPTKRRKKRQSTAPKAFTPGAHAFWSGTISFGMVSIPVQLFPTHQSTAGALRLLARDGTPLQRRYFSATQDEEVQREHIIRGYELEDGSYVAVNDDELESLEPRKSHTIDLKQFVPRAQVSPAYFERAYVLAPTGDSNKAYHLLAKAMEETNRVGIATFVMRDKEYLVAILSEGGVLRAETLRFHDELRSPEDIGLPEKPQLNRSLVSKFVAAIHKNSAKKLSADELHDDRDDRLRALAERKRKQGVDIVEMPEVATADADSSDGDDVDERGLLEAIRESLQGTNGHSKAIRNRYQNGHAARKHTGGVRHRKPVRSSARNGHSRKTAAHRRG
jgi:DNA end-binding protein Ku